MNVVIVTLQDGQWLPGWFPEPAIPSRRRPRAWLTDQQSFCFPLKRCTTIGRSLRNDLVLRGAATSRQHAAVIEAAPATWWLCDLGSRAGSWHNGRRMAVPVRLRDGDHLRFADSTFTFHDSGQS